MDGTRARALLGVSAHATPDELRRAFRQRALSTHPDHGGDAVVFDETIIAFRLLHPRSPAARAPRGDAHKLSEHVPFDAYDSSTRVVALTPQPARPSFAEVLGRVAAAAAA